MPLKIYTVVTYLGVRVVGWGILNIIERAVIARLY